MKRNLKEANYNLSISDLNTTDGDALSQILAMASQADNDEMSGDANGASINDPYANEFENGMNNDVAVDTPFDNINSETPIDDISSDETIENDDYDFNIDDYKQYGIDENDFNEPENYNDPLVTNDTKLIDENDFNEPENYADELKQNSTTLVNEADAEDIQKGYSIIVNGKSYGFLPTENEYSDEEIKNQFLKQYISEKGEEFPYADEITIVKKDNVDEDLLLSKNEEDPTDVATQKINDFDKYPPSKQVNEYQEEYENDDEYLDSFEYMYDNLINGNIAQYKEKLNKLSKKEFANFIKWADNMGIDREDLKLNYITEDDNGAEEFEDTEHLQIDENWIDDADENEPHQGWTNAQTWNVALELENNKDLYNLKYKYSSEHPNATYDDFIKDTGLINKTTADGIKFNDPRLDKEELTTHMLHRQLGENDEFEQTAMNGEDYTDASLEEQINQALFNAGVINEYSNKKIEESNYSPKLADPKTKKPNQANYQDVNIDADSKSGTLGFEDNANPSQPIRGQQNKPAKIVETAKHLLSKVATNKKEKLQTRFIYKLMNEGVSYSRAKDIILKLK